MASKTSAAPGIVPQNGPWGWMNYQMMLAGNNCAGSLEIAFYTDALSLRGAAATGPYSVLIPLDNTDWFTRLRRRPRIGLIARVDQHLGESDNPYYIDDEWESTEGPSAHGGDAGEETAALLSLVLGIRLRSAGLIRVFNTNDDDARGHPHSPNRPPPLASGETYSLLPYAISKEINLDGVDLLLDRYGLLSARKARSLVRAARSYQEALWLADSDPRQAWLRLVTAAEIASQIVVKKPSLGQDVIDPEIRERLDLAGDTRLTQLVTEKLLDQARVKARFVDFLMAYRPARPNRRPSSVSRRIEWSKLPEYLAEIYNVRSKDLHAGVPVPAPMCQPPFISSAGIADEHPHLPVGSPRAPMCLHIFEYVVRGALLNWWKSTSA